MKHKRYKKTKWLRFYIVDRKPKTIVMHVRNTSSQYLGEIRWYAPWHQYCFNVSTVGTQVLTFNHQCLTDIAAVLSELNAKQKEGPIQTDGIYLLRDNTGYKKTVEASFDLKGKLLRLVDKDGNNWMDSQHHVLWGKPRKEHL